MPAGAAMVASAPHPAGSHVIYRPNNTISTIDLQAFSDCGEFGGQISVYRVTTSEDIYWEFQVVGTLQVHCA